MSSWNLPAPTDNNVKKKLTTFFLEVAREMGMVVSSPAEESKAQTASLPSFPGETLLEFGPTHKRVDEEVFYVVLNDWVDRAKTERRTFFFLVNGKVDSNNTPGHRYSSWQAAVLALLSELNKQLQGMREECQQASITLNNNLWRFSSNLRNETNAATS